MFQNDQVLNGEIGLVVLTVVPIFVAALVGFAILMRRDTVGVVRDPGNASRVNNQ